MIRWKLSLNSGPEKVFELLSTSKGRKKFWAESAEDIDGMIHFVFPNGQTYNGKIIKTLRPTEFCIDYFQSEVRFLLNESEKGGTELTLINSGFDPEEYNEIHAGWVSVLLNLKAVADFGADLRNHDPDRSWDQGFVEN